MLYLTNNRDALFKIVHDATYQNYRQHMPKVCADLVPEEETLNRDHMRNLFFGNYIEPDADPKYYDEVTLFSEPKLKKKRKLSLLYI